MNEIHTEFNLLPCAHCGAEGQLLSESQLYFLINCTCGIVVQREKKIGENTRSTVMEIWNTRA